MNNKKFIETKKINDYEVFTDNGWIDIDAIHKTIKYDIWIVKTKDYILECADKHILFNENLEEIFVENLKVGDGILTEKGIQYIINIEKTNEKCNMFDLQLNEDSDKRYFTNGILSHNTTIIRHLIKKIKQDDNKNNVLYFPPTMVDSITEPSFINFISEWVADSEGKNYLLIEDAEPLLESRDSSRNIGITNLLNITDGLLNDILNIQIIATFNTSLKNIDKALLRPERLIARKEFNNLSIENAKVLCDKIGINSELIDKEVSLADLYAMKKESKPIIHGFQKKIKVGFQRV